MQIRSIEERDFSAVARLLRVLAKQFIVHESTPEGASTFLRENDETGLRGFAANGCMYYVAESGGAIAGFIAVREHKHLFHLFVATEWQRQGVARKLWEVARRAAREGGNDGVFTVNSSTYALPVYEAMGFERSAPMQCQKGLCFNPMRLVDSGQV